MVIKHTYVCIYAPLQELNAKLFYEARIQNWIR